MTKKYEIDVVVSNGVVTQRYAIAAERIITKEPYWTFMLHRGVLDQKTWTVTEFDTGRTVCGGLPTRKAAIEKLNNLLETRFDDLKAAVKLFLDKDGYINEVWKGLDNFKTNSHVNDAIRYMTGPDKGETERNESNRRKIKSRPKL